jgi:NAD-dependent deacetylase
MSDLIERTADILANATSAVALTGAGISVESGIPPFRGKGGLWEKIDPMKYAHIDAFLDDPETVWEVLIKDMKTILDTARPNPGHTSLADLEQLGILKTVITQNVDGLHQMAGNSDVIEFHGNFAWQRCLDCSRSIETSRVDLAQMPPRCSCGGILRPDCVFFGEMIPHEALIRSQQCIGSLQRAMLVIGTSATGPTGSHHALHRQGQRCGHHRNQSRADAAHVTHQRPAPAGRRRQHHAPAGQGDPSGGPPA